MILKASEENFVEKTTWCRTGIIFQTLLSANHQIGELNSVQHNFNIDCLEGINASYYLLPYAYYIKSKKIGLVKIGITGMSDDLTHDKVVVVSPEIKMGYVKPIS